MSNDVQKEEQIQPNLTINAVLGETCWLLSQSPVHRYNFFLADLEWMVLPAIFHGQFKLYRTDKNPAAMAIWALVSDEVEEKLMNGATKLTPKDWKSGEKIWLIDVISPYGKMEEILSDLKQTSLQGKSFKYHKTQPDGTREIITVTPGTQA